MFVVVDPSKMYMAESSLIPVKIFENYVVNNQIDGFLRVATDMSLKQLFFTVTRAHNEKDLG